MASSDRGFRALAQDSPGAIVALLRCGAAQAVAALPGNARMQPIVIEDLVKFGEDRGEARGEARGEDRGEARGKALGLAEAVLGALDARGFATSDALRERVLGETAIEQLRAWHKRAFVASSVDEVFAGS